MITDAILNYWNQCEISSYFLCKSSLQEYKKYKNGLDKYTGLKELAVNHGIIHQTGATYQLADGTKLGYYKKWKDDKDLWNNTILPQIETSLQEKYCYGS